jgi:hypothetical protein
MAKQHTANMSRKSKVGLIGGPVRQKDGREEWRVSVDGKVRTVETTRRSAAVMGEAVRIYRDALKRLAEK